MAVEKDGKKRWLGYPGMVLGICICLTVILVAKIVEEDSDAAAQETLKDLAARVGAMEPNVDKHGHDIRMLQDAFVRIGSLEQRMTALQAKFSLQERAP